VRLGAAAGLLQSHHSAQRVPMTWKGNNGDDGGKKPSWTCQRCKAGDKEPYVNFGWRTKCHKCNVQKGQCFGANVVGGAPHSRQRTPASRQVDSRQGQGEQKLANSLALERAAKRKLEGELQALRARLQSKKAGEAEADDAMADDSGKPKEDADFNKEIVQLDNEIKSLRGIRGAEPLLAAKIQEREELVCEQRAAKPAKQQIQHLEKFLAKSRKQLAHLEEDAYPKALAGIERAQQELVERQTKAIGVEDSIREAKAQVAAMEVQLKELHTKEACSVGGGPQQFDLDMASSETLARLQKLAQLLAQKKAAEVRGLQAEAQAQWSDFENLLGTVLAAAASAPAAHAAPSEGERLRAEEQRANAEVDLAALHDSPELPDDLDAPVGGVVPSLPGNGAGTKGKGKGPSEDPY
jgi:hypothetical protein